MYAVDIHKIAITVAIFFQKKASNLKDTLATLKITENYDRVDWGSVIRVLTAYSYNLIGVTQLKLTREKGEAAADFAIETITKYLENPEKFDPSRNPDLVNYLKYNICRRLISNSKNLKSTTQESSDSFFDDDGEEVFLDYEDSQEYFSNHFHLDERIDVEQKVKMIEEALAGDEKLLEVFYGRYHFGEKRSEVCESLGITAAEYDNRFKRLERICRKIIP